MVLKWLKKKTQPPPASPGDETTPPPLDSPAPSMHSPSSEVSASAVPSPFDSSPEPTPAGETPAKNGGLFARLKSGLAKTREILTTDIDKLFSGRKHIDEEMLEDIEELLITSDIGVQTAMSLMDSIALKASRIEGSDGLKRLLKGEILSLLESATVPPPPVPTVTPHVIMVVGVNGVGKTTTIGKLAALRVREGRKVLIAAADTFRAAAVEQLTVWAQRAGAELVRHQEKADPAAVAYDSIEAALARQIDFVYIDTAGRLHTKINLMEEIKKVQRTIAKKMPGAPHEVLLVLDATTGQNALAQAKLFDESLGLTGLVLTKLDGTAKGGIVISICQQLQLPLHFIGVGEAIDDLQPFDARLFVDALF